MGLILYSSLQFFLFFSVSFTKSAGFVFLPGKASLISISGAVLLVRTSLACLLTVGVRIFVENVVLE